MDALQFIEFVTQFEPVDLKIVDINITNERKKTHCKGLKNKMTKKQYRHGSPHFKFMK